MTLAVAIGGPFVPEPVVPWAFGLVVVAVVLIGLAGVGQDAANSGVSPQEIAPLPAEGA